MITRTQWEIVDAVWVDNDPEVSVIAITLKSAGKHYTVACSGPKGMKSDEFIPATTAAAECMTRAVGARTSVVDGTDPTFDTGSQRAN